MVEHPRPYPQQGTLGHHECLRGSTRSMARLAQSAERKALNLVVVGSSPTVGVLIDTCKLSSPHATKRDQFNMSCTFYRTLPLRIRP